MMNQFEVWYYNGDRLLVLHGQRQMYDFVWGFWTPIKDL